MPQIHVNGRDYQLVAVNDLTLDEAIVLHDWSKLTLDRVADVDGFHPGLIAGLIHISVARGEPGEPSATIRKTVGRIPVADLEKVFMDVSEEVADDADPPIVNAETLPPDGSGDGSSATGENHPDSSPANGSGSHGSDTGATFDQQISVS
jgi:hypothetical protein